MPWPVSLNRLYRVSGSKIYKTQEGKNYRNELALLAMSEMKKQKFETIKDYACVKINFFAPDNRDHDIDNLNKILLDSLQFAQVFKNDRYVVRLFEEKIYPIKPHDGFFDAVICATEKLVYNNVSIK